MPRKRKVEPIVVEGGTEFAGGKPIYTQEERAEVVRLAEAGRSRNEIADITGMSTGWISILVHAAGLSFPEEKRTAAATAARVRQHRMQRLEIIEQHQLALTTATARYQLHVLDHPGDTYGQALRAREVREISAALESVARIDQKAGEWFQTDVAGEHLDQFQTDVAGEHLDQFQLQIRFMVENGIQVSLNPATGEARWLQDGQEIHRDVVPLPELPAQPERPELEAGATPPKGPTLAGTEGLADDPPIREPRETGPVLEGETEQ